MPSDNQEMSFWSHLDALRSVVLRIGVWIVAIWIVMFAYMREIFQWVILWPCRGDFPLYRLMSQLSSYCSGSGDVSWGADFNLNLINTELANQLLVHLSTAGWLSVVVGFPIIIYHLWTFVSPGLYERERQGAKRAFLWGNLMFYLGMVVGYFLVFPITLRFLVEYQLSEHITNMITLSSYIDNFLLLTLLMGAIFELPLVAWMLGKMGLLKRSFFSRWRRHAIVAIAIVAACITPTGDPFTLFVAFVPIYMLWEFSSALVPRGDTQ